MLAAQRLAGYSLGQADILRKAMGKKDPEVMRNEEGALRRGGGGSRASPRGGPGDLPSRSPSSAGYGFNRAHAVGYALVAYVAGWLKTHFPLHFLASLLTAQQRSGDKDEAHRPLPRRRRGPRHPHPSAGCAAERRRSDRGGKRVSATGLAAVKQVGSRTATAIEAARRECGGFESLGHFLESVDSRVLNRGVVEALACAGRARFRRRLAGPDPGSDSRRHRSGRESPRSAGGGGPDPCSAARTSGRRMCSARRRTGPRRNGLRAGARSARLLLAGPSGNRTPRRAPGSRERFREGPGLPPGGAGGHDRRPRPGLRKRSTRDGRAMANFTLEDDTGTVGHRRLPGHLGGMPSPGGRTRGPGPRPTEGGDLEGREIGGRGKTTGSPGRRAEIIAARVRLAAEAAFAAARRVELVVSEPRRAVAALRQLLDGHPGQDPARAPASGPGRRGPCCRPGPKSTPPPPSRATPFGCSGRTASFSTGDPSRRPRGTRKRRRNRRPDGPAKGGRVQQQTGIPPGDDIPAERFARRCESVGIRPEMPPRFAPCQPGASPVPVPPALSTDCYGTRFA